MTDAELLSLLQRYVAGDYELGELLRSASSNALCRAAAQDVVFVYRSDVVAAVLTRMQLDAASQRQVSLWAYFGLFGEIPPRNEPIFDVEVEPGRHDVMVRVLKRLWNVPDDGWLTAAERRTLIHDLVAFDRA